MCAGCTGCAGRVSSGHRGVDPVTSVVSTVGRAGVYGSTRGGVVAVAAHPMASSSVIVTVATVVAVSGFVGAVVPVTGILTVGSVRLRLMYRLRGNAVAYRGAGECRIHRLFERSQDFFEGRFGANTVCLRGQRQVVRGDDRQEHFRGGERIHGGGAHFCGHVDAEQHSGNACVRHADGFAEVLHGTRHGDAAALGFDAGQERAVIAVEDDGDIHWPSP